MILQSREKFEELLFRFDRLLGQFLNNPFGKRDLLKMALGKAGASQWLASSVSDLTADVARKTDTKFLGGDTADQLAWCHNELIRHIPPANIVARHAHKPRLLGVPPKGTLGQSMEQAIQAASSGLRQHGCRLLPICSVADGTHVPEWSDVDIILLLDNAPLSGQGLLALQGVVRPLKASFLLIDPLQDHGLFVLSLLHQRYYAQAFMPLVVLESGYIWPPDAKAPSLQIIRSRSMDERPLQMVIEEVTKAEQQLPNNFLAFRMLLHRIFLLPSLYYQSRGEHLYKPDAITRIQQQVNGIDWSFLREATYIYRHWKIERKYRQWVGLGMIRRFPWLVPELLKYYYSRKSLPTTEMTVAKLHKGLKNACMYLKKEF